MNKLDEFSYDELTAEIARRDALAADEAKDKSCRTFYRKIFEGRLKLKEKNAILKKYTAEQQESLLEDDGSGYILDKETPEEVATRLSRKANAYYNYDQWVCDFYENGKMIGHEFSTSSLESSAENWENDTWEPHCLEEYLGYSSWHPARFCDWYPKRN